MLERLTLNIVFVDRLRPEANAKPTKLMNKKLKFRKTRC